MCRLWWTKKAQSCSPRTANGALGAVRKIFAMLRDSGYVVSDPTAKLERLSLKPTEFFIPGKEEFVRIVEEIRRAPLLRKYREKSLDSPAADMVAFLAYSGLRIEEARRLVWGDIGKDSISVPAIKHAVKRRILYINPALRDVIERMKKTNNNLTATSPVFVIENPRKALTNACVRLGLPHVRVHDLRHFFATTCIEQGVDIPTVAKWLGHQDGGALAMRVYGHLRDEHSKEQASRLRF
jgi:integrase